MEDVERDIPQMQHDHQALKKTVSGNTEKLKKQISNISETDTVDAAVPGADDQHEDLDRVTSKDETVMRSLPTQQAQPSKNDRTDGFMIFL